MGKVRLSPILMYWILPPEGSERELSFALSSNKE
jgi:hypothetical protein